MTAKQRGRIVAKVMREMGYSLPQASHYVKVHKLYVAKGPSAPARRRKAPARRAPARRGRKRGGEVLRLY